MNSFILGLKLLKKELKERNFLTKDVKDILADSTESSEIAVELVSDFLTFDKIDSGILKLDATELKVWALLMKTAKPFYTQVDMITNSLSMKTYMKLVYLTL